MLNKSDNSLCMFQPELSLSRQNGAAIINAGIFEIYQLLYLVASLLFMVCVSSLNKDVATSLFVATSFNFYEVFFTLPVAGS